MKKSYISIIILLFLSLNSLFAQYKEEGESITSTSDFLTAEDTYSRAVLYNLSESGESKPLLWGLDLAWLSEGNIRRGIAFMGKENVDIVRSSFTPTSALVDGDLAEDELATVNERINIISTWLGNMDIALNSDHPSVDESFTENAANWAELIQVTKKHHEDAGHTVITVSPFNEPDYSATGQGDIDDFYAICGELRNRSEFDNVRISGGNTLSTDEALGWYNTLKDRLDEGNTHQLAGSFDSYTTFYETVRANGHHATNDEMHNVMEAMVGVEYGLQTGIWWGTAEYARGEFVKASDGVRLGYAENRSKWTAASVYRNTDGEVQLFGGASERQAYTTTYSAVSEDRDVFYNGYGPQREYSMVIPGGTSYQTDQPNAERVVNIQWGDDIQPVIDGRYILVNRNSSKVIQVANASTEELAYLEQGSNSGASHQQWDVTPVESTVGGDFSYFTFTDVNSGLNMDLLNWSLDNGTNIITYSETLGANQQWFLEYAEDGWFYIRSRQSACSLQVEDASTDDNAAIIQYEKTEAYNQQWRFLPVDAPVEFDAPEAPQNLSSTAYKVSIRLDWDAPSDEDVSSYTIFRSESADGDYNTIARNVTTTAYVDNTIEAGKTYYYKVKAIDYSLNYSAYSIVVSASASDENTLICRLPFDGNCQDSTINLMHSAPYGDISYTDGKMGTGALVLDGADDFVKLPSNIANSQAITIAAWVYWKGGSAWQRIFDFGHDENQSMQLIARTSSGTMQFSICDGNETQAIDMETLDAYTWSHIAVTLGDDGFVLYVNGEKVAESTDITIRPSDVKALLNYIGRGQTASLTFNGSIDDFRVYNYQLTQSEVVEASEIQSDDIKEIEDNDLLVHIWPIPAIDEINISIKDENAAGTYTMQTYSITGKLVHETTIEASNNKQITISDLSSGIYIIKVMNEQNTYLQKVIVQK